MVKFFPAGTYGGVGLRNHCMGPTGLPMCLSSPRGEWTSTICLNTPTNPLSMRWEAAGSASSAIANQDFASITAVERSSIDVLLGFELAHVGINGADEA